MKINAQENLLYLNKLGMKAMQDEPTAEPQAPTTKTSAYSLMDAMEMQGRNNISFGINRRAFLKIGKEAFTEKSKEVLPEVNDAGVKLLTEKVKEAPVLNIFERGANFVGRIGNRIMSRREALERGGMAAAAALGTAVVLPTLTSCIEIKSEQKEKVVFDLNELLALFKENIDNQQKMIDELKQNNAYLQILVEKATNIDNNTDDIKDYLQDILNSNLDADEKLAKILDAIGDTTTYLQLYLDEIQELRKDMNNNANVAHNDQLVMKELLTLLNDKMEKSNYIALKCKKLLKQLLAGTISIADILKEIAIEVTNIRKDMNTGFNNTINAINEAGDKIDEKLLAIQNGIDEHNAKLDIMIAQNEAIKAYLNSINGGIVNLTDMAEALNISVNELKDILADLNINVEVKVDSSDIIAAIDKNTNAVEGQSVILNAILEAVQYQNGKLNNLDGLKESLEELVKLAKENNELLKDSNNTTTLIYETLTAIYKKLESQGGDISEKLKGITNILKNIENNTANYIKQEDVNTIIDLLIQILNKDYCDCDCDGGGNEGILDDLADVFGK